ncbi:MAG: isoprenylcysteine carboxylmethyltransferase family protein [Chloroflexi bacterium]|nr:isoprenylcysteine carboxylmethyltransferase family protein [Chloroflexota bacterium]
MQGPSAMATPPVATPARPRQGWRRALARGVVAAGPIVYFAGLLVWQVRADWPVWREPRIDLETALAVVAAAYIGLQLATYWRKPPPLASRHDWRAVLATALAIDALGLSVGQPVTQPDALAPALGLSLAGTALAFWSVIHLGRSFSLLPQARQLVTTGPYRYVRHPIYLGGVLITLGEIWLRFSPTVVALNLLFVTAQIVRLRYEESLLSAAFPEYDAYRARTSALIPGLPWP